MRRLLLPAALAAGMLATLTGGAGAHGGGAGIGLSVQINVNYWGWSGQGGGPGGSGCCDSCFIPGWSPCYDAPKMFGGMHAARYTFNPAPLYPGTIRYPGGYDAVGFVPPAPPYYYHAPAYPPHGYAAPFLKPHGDFVPGKIIEGGPPVKGAIPDKVIEKGPPPKMDEAPR
jgi:hypothetical protein